MKIMSEKKMLKMYSSSYWDNSSFILTWNRLRLVLLSSVKGVFGPIWRKIEISCIETRWCDGKNETWFTDSAEKIVQNYVPIWFEKMSTGVIIIYILLSSYSFLRLQCFCPCAVIRDETVKSDITDNATKRIVQLKHLWIMKNTHQRTWKSNVWKNICIR